MQILSKALDICTKFETKFCLEQTKTTASNTCKDVHHQKICLLWHPLPRSKPNVGHNILNSHCLYDSCRKVFIFHRDSTSTIDCLFGSASMAEGNALEQQEAGEGSREEK